jgi:hypothetical protein
MNATYPTHPLLDFMILFILVKNASYEVPCYATFSNLLSLHPTLVQIFSSASCSQTLSVYVLPLMSETKTHTK